MSPDLSAGLALDVVLNEIVEQACLATGATGAAIILERDGEMVCRATSGANAPELGARLGSERGLTAECIKTRQAQRCDDAQADPRADVEASRILGVRSVLVLPLLRNGDLAGVLEVFSSRPQAFRERDELTLEALTRRILKNLGEGSAPFIAAPQSSATPVPPNPASELESQARSTNLTKDEVSPEIFGRTPRSGLDVITFVLGVVVVACAVLLGTLVGFRLGWRRTAAGRGRVTNSASGGATPYDAGVQSSDARPATDAGSTPASSVRANSTAVVSKKEDAGALKAPAASPQDAPLPAGSLRVYENGKEVFRMSPAEGQSEGASSADTYGPGVQRASKVEQAPILEVSPEVAEGSLLHRVEPDYPEEARQQQIQGTVVLDVHTGRDGSVQEVKLLSGQPLLAEAAIAAVKQWRFKPRMVKGEPVEMQTTVTLSFKLPR